MATKYGVNGTLISNTVPAGKAGVGELGGAVRLHYDEYTLTADLAAADVIYMGGLLPKGARIIDAFIKSADLDAQSAGSLDFGWLASDDAVESAATTAFHSAMDVHTAADVVYASINQAAATGIGYKLTAAVQPVITIQGETDATSGTIKSFIFYVMD